MRFISRPTPAAPLCLDGYTVFMPSLSIGNVGQLTADILVASLDMRLVGSLDTDLVVPVVGADPYHAPAASAAAAAAVAATASASATPDAPTLDDVTGMASALDVYVADEARVAVIQQRAPLIKGKRAIFATRLVGWLSKAQATALVWLHSADAALRLEAEIDDPIQLRYQASEPFGVASGAALAALTDAGVSQLTRDPEVLPLDAVPTIDPATVRDEVTPSRSGLHGLSARVYDAAVATELPVLVVQAFAAEGDNIRDALNMASLLHQAFNFPLTTSQWTVPPSWALLFGGHMTDPTLFM
ncbi:proteasome assembly chaperone 2 [Thecamonas trahens ATCC 50062]|uniref:Proteasome assembly chaperone 2 n=1 Tax=Thecamonas trahens ATCC 50062 TaxID=461836 RepID=A0A0L0DBY2_THETB|nr:proteasome assembly chaperone 2 [Thecamonas trahens ATCC 50062]KNC49576.1 proteasome assembly chaperone 2 [Thecamonas trahens ATCC 50062]|eukprot:XP_013757685.1 proteasome assembly chaperone 2 [Thecamonas trahens ATCC 50062]